MIFDYTVYSQPGEISARDVSSAFTYVSHWHLIVGLPLSFNSTVIPLFQKAWVLPQYCPLPALTMCISLCGLRQPLLTLLPWHLLKVGMLFFFFFFVVWTYLAALAPCPLPSVRCWSLCYPPPHRSFSRHIPKYVSRFLFYWLLWIPGKQTIGLLFALSLSLGQMLVQEVFNEWICKRFPRLFIPTSLLIRTSESIALQSEKDVAGRINAEFDDIKVLMNCWNTDKEPFENLLSVL